MKIKLSLLPCCWFLAFSFAVLAPAPARAAAALTWDGSANGFWTNAANWNLGFRPTNGAALTFPPGPVQLLATNTGLSGAATNLHSLTLSGSNYVLVAHTPLSITNGLTNVVAASTVTNTVRAHLVPRASQTWVTSAKSVLVLASNLNFTNLTLTLANASTVQADGAINGGAGSTLLKTNNGVLEINGTASLTHLNVQDGTVQVDGTLSGLLTVGAGATLSGSGTVPAFTNFGIVSPAGLSSGVLTVSGGAAVFSAGSSLLLNLLGTTPGTSHDQLKVSSPPNLSGGVPLILLSYNPLVGDSFVIITNTGASAFTTTFSGLPEGATQTVSNVKFRISYVGGSGNDVTLMVVGFTPSGITRTWNGAAMSFLWSNPTNWVGNAIPQQGDDVVFSAGAAGLFAYNDLGTNIVFNSFRFDQGGYTLDGDDGVGLLGGVTMAAGSGTDKVLFPVTLLGSQTFSNMSAGGLTFDGPINLGTHTLTVEAVSAINFDGVLSGTGGLVKSGAGNLTLRGSNTFSGPVNLLAGRATVDNPTSLGTIASGTTVGPSAILQLRGDIILAEPLSVAGEVVSITGTNRIQSSVLLTATNATFSSVFATALIVDGPVTEFAPGTHLHLAGARVVLNGTNNYTRTMAEASQCIINGPQPGNAVVLVVGSLGGNGVVGTMIPDLSGVSVAPGESPGILTSSNIAWTSFVTYRVEMAGSAPGSGHDQLIVHGTVNIGSGGGARLEVTNTFTAAPGTVFTIIDNDGVDPVVGTFSGQGEGSFVTNNGAVFRVSYVGGDGNDVTLTRQFVPTGSARVWTGLGVGGNWSNPTNWVGTNVPQAGDTLEFPVTAANRVTTNDFAFFVADSILITGSNTPGNFTFRGNRVDLNGGLIITSQNTSLHSLICPVRLLAAQTFSVGTNSGLSISSAVDNNGFLLTATSAGNSALVLPGPINGAGGLTLASGGLGITLSGSNSFTGPFTLASGGIGISQSNSMGAAAGPAFVGAGSFVVLNNPFTLTKSFLSLTGAIITSTINVLDGEVRLPGPSGTLAPIGAGRITVNSSVTGSGQLIKTDTGLLQLSGTNTHTGGTVINGGVLLVHGSTLFGTVTVASTATLGGTGVVGTVAMNGGQIAPGASPGLLTASNVAFSPSGEFVVELNGPTPGVTYDQLAVRGTLDLAGAALRVALGHTPAIGDIFKIIDNDGADAVLGTFAGLPEGATFTTNGSILRVSYAGGDGNDVTLTRLFTPTGATRTWDGGGANAAWSNRTNWVGDVAPVEGDSLFFPFGAARKINTNDFPAFTAFNLITYDPLNSGYTNSGAPFVVAAGIFANSAGTCAISNSIRLLAPQTFSAGAINAILDLRGPLDLQTNTLTFTGPALANTRLSGVVSGSGGLLQTGASNNTVTLAATNTYTGVTRVQSGTLIVTTDGALGSTNGNTVVASGATLELSGPFGGGGFTIAEPIVLDGIPPGAATINNASGTNSLTGAISIAAGDDAGQFSVTSGELRVNGVVSGGGVLKAGLSKLLLNGNNIHTNRTRVSRGVLIVNGSQPGSAVIVDNTPGTILGGQGTVGALLPGGGLISPGSSPGILTFAGNFNCSAAQSNLFELNGNVAGTGYDQITVLGDIFLNSTGLRLVFGFTPAFGDSFLLIKNNGGNPVSGTFAGLPEGALITNGPAVLRLTYVGGDGNDVTLSRIVVPTGVTRVWDGGGANNLWSNPTNWVGDIAPQQGDDVVFPGTSVPRLAPTFDAGTNASFNSLVFGSNYTVTAAPGHSLRLVAGVTATNTTGILSLAVPVALENSQTWIITKPGQTLQAQQVDLGFFTLTHSGAGGLWLAGTVSGAGGLVGNATGTLALTVSNSFSGTVIMNAGTLLLQSAAGLGSPLAGTFIGTTASLEIDLPTGLSVDEPLTLAGTLLAAASGTNTWQGPITVAGAQARFDFGSVYLLNLNGPVTGGGFRNLNIGTLAFNSASPYAGPVRVEQNSTFLANASQPTLAVVLTNNGFLGGTGVVGQVTGSPLSLGTIAPGPTAAPGSLTTGNLFLTNTTLTVDVNGLTPGTGYDQLNVNGTVDLSNGRLVVNAGFTPPNGQVFTILNNDGADAILGTFRFTPQGALLTNNGVVFQISYTGGDGNDVTLTRVIAAPSSTVQFSGLNTNGLFTLAGQGIPNVAYVIEAAPHLVPPIPWQPVSTNISDGTGRYEFIDFGSTNFPMRFYRVVSP